MRLSKNRTYKAIMIDVDGTLVPNNASGMPSKKVRDAIKKASKKIHVGVATARPYFLVKKILKEISLTGPSIVNGGAQIIEFPSGKFLYEKVMRTSDVFETVKILEKSKLPFYINDDDKEFRLESAKNYFPKKPLQVYIVGLSGKKADSILKELSHLHTIAAHKVADWQVGKVGILISDVEATKQHGIFKVAKILKISTKDIIGVGDGYNDFPLLSACGLKIAMGNAVEELKTIADYIAPSVDEDGVSDVIERFVL